LAPSTRRFSQAAIAHAVATLGFAALGTVGCGQQCDRHPNEPPNVWKDGITDPAAGTYFSALVDGPYLDFPAGRTYRFIHGLGGVPQSYQAWLAFSAHPGASGFVDYAGNQVTFEAWTSEYVDARNDTCSEIWIRVELSDPIRSSVGDAALPRSEPASDGGP
jgi:hypothetical protein